MDNTLVYREAGLSTGITIIVIIIILNKLVRAGLYTLKSVWVFSILLSLSISYGTDKENVYTNQESLGDHFPFSCDVNVWFRSDFVRRILLLVTLRGSPVKGHTSTSYKNWMVKLQIMSFNKIIGSISVSGQLPTYPSPNPTLTSTCCQFNRIWTLTSSQLAC